MRIVIDMQGAQTESRFRGIGRYSLAISKSIVRNRGKNEIIIALNGLFPETIEPIRAAFEGLLPQENIRVWHTFGPVRECEPGNEWRRMVAESIRETFLASLDPDVVFITSIFEGYVDDAVTSIGVFNSQIPTVVTLHDLIPLLHSEEFLDPNPQYKQYYLRKIEYLKQASGFLAVSESSAQEVIDAFGFRQDLVVNTSEACDPMFRPLKINLQTKKNMFRKLNLSRSFIMYCSGVEYTKNLPRFIQAYSKLILDVRKKHQLLIAGKISEGNLKEIKAIAVSVGLSSDEIVFSGYVNDEDLVQLYNLCKLFVVPSIHEGFGLPALEAMSCGAPVISSNITSLPEVIGWVDALFDPCDIESISRKIMDALTDESFRKDLMLHGVEQAKKFSWDKSARRAVQALERIAPSKGSKQEKIESLIPKLIQVISNLVPANISDSEILNIARSINSIHTSLISKQLFVDISELVQRDSKSGIQRVTRSILKELIENPPEGYMVTPVYATIDTHGYYYARKFTAQFSSLITDQCDEPIDYHFGDIFLGLDLQQHVVIAQKDYLAALRRDGVKVFFVVHDLLPIFMPDVFHPQVGIVHEAWLQVVSSLDGAVCVSQTVAKELRDYWFNNQGLKRLRSFKIGWFHHGADIENSVPSRGLTDNAKYVIDALVTRPIFLTVSTLEPRKGQMQILDAFEILWKQAVDINMVIVGKQGWMVETLIERIRQHPELNKRLFWLEGISDEYLEKIYSISTCLIAASKGEGFGLPLIEAARHKIPIIARDIPVFHEVAGEHAFYFSGFEPNNLSDAIKNWLVLNTEGKAPQSINMPWLTWKQSTRQLLKVILPEITYSDSEKI